MHAERQRTFTIEKCVQKYGEEIGFDVWKERQIKWSKKVEEKYKNGEFTRFCKHSYSNKEIKFFEHLLSVYAPSKEYFCAVSGSKQFFRHFKKEGITLAYDFVCGKKIIEFNGDYWHCNPSFYQSTFFNKSLKKFATEKWDYDRRKIELIEEAGYQTLVVWESEYDKYPEQTIKKCIEHLQ
jgi:hypothetical protein